MKLECAVEEPRKRVRGHEHDADEYKDEQLEQPSPKFATTVDYVSEESPEHDRALFALARTQQHLRCEPSLPGHEPFWMTPEPRTTTSDATLLAYYEPKAKENLTQARAYMHTGKCPVVLAQPCVSHEFVKSSVVFRVSLIMQFPTVANGLLDVKGIQKLCPGKCVDDIAAAGFSDWLYPHVSAKLSRASSYVTMGSKTFSDQWKAVAIVYNRCRYVDGPHTGYLEIEDLMLHNAPVHELRMLSTDQQSSKLNHFVWRCFMVALRLHMFGDLCVSADGQLRVL